MQIRLLSDGCTTHDKTVLWGQWMSSGKRRVGRGDFWLMLLLVLPGRSCPMPGFQGNYASSTLDLKNCYVRVSIKQKGAGCLFSHYFPNSKCYLHLCDWLNYSYLGQILCWHTPFAGMFLLPTGGLLSDCTSKESIREMLLLWTS